MRPEDVRKHLETQPFAPFRIYVSDGQSYDVRHPEMCLIARSTVYVGIITPKSRRIAEDVAHISLMHITRIEPVNGRTPSARRR